MSPRIRRTSSALVLLALLAQVSFADASKDLTQSDVPAPRRNKTSTILVGVAGVGLLTVAGLYLMTTSTTAPPKPEMPGARPPTAAEQVVAPSWQAQFDLDVERQRKNVQRDPTSSARRAAQREQWEAAYRTWNPSSRRFDLRPPIPPKKPRAEHLQGLGSPQPPTTSIGVHLYGWPAPSGSGPLSRARQPPRWVRPARGYLQH